MTVYGIGDVERVLRLSRGTIRSLVAAGFVIPARGPRKAWQFSFQDLIVLRAAQALVRADVPTRRIMRSLRELRRKLPEAMPLSGLAIGALGDRVVVRERGGRWQADDGQYVLELDAGVSSGGLRVIEPARDAPETVGQSGLARGTDKDGCADAHGAGTLTQATATRSARALDAAHWFARGAELEDRDTSAAIASYERAVAADPTLVDAAINLGRLLHDRGELVRAENVYLAAARTCGDDAVLWFNLGVLLEDMGRVDDAREAYEAALRSDADFADGHYNLALLFEKMKRPKDALRHMARYRILLRRSR